MFVYQVNFKMSRFQMKIVTCDLKILIFFSWHLLHFTSLYLALASPTYDGDYHLQQILTYASLIICLNSGTSLSTTVIFNPPSCDPRSLIVKRLIILAFKHYNQSLDLGPRRGSGSSSHPLWPDSPGSYNFQLWGGTRNSCNFFYIKQAG